MRHIGENRIVSISSNSEDQNFPIERVLDHHPGRKYKSAGPAFSTVTITAGVIGGCSDIMIAGTNAGSAVVTATDPNAIELASIYQQLIPYTEPTVSNLDTASNVADGTYDAQTVGIVFGDNSVQREAYSDIDNSYLLQYFSCHVKMSDGGVPDPSRSSAVGDFSLVLNGTRTTNVSEPVVEYIGGGEYRISAYRESTGPGSTFGIVKYAATQSTRGFTVSKINLARVDTHSLPSYSPNHSGIVDTIISHSSVTLRDSSVIINTPISISGTVIQRSETGAMWIQLAQTLNVPTELSIVLTGPLGQPVEIGVITSKIAATYGGRNPAYGFTEQPVDYSIVAENSNGSVYYKKRNTVRGYNGITIIMTNADALQFLAMSRRMGLIPSAWKITDAAGNDWVVYARFNGMPTVQYAYLNHSIVAFNLIEVI